VTECTSAYITQSVDVQSRMLHKYVAIG